MSDVATDSLPRPGRPGPPPRISVALPYLSESVKRFLSREAGSSAILLAATVAALVWANLPGATYLRFWSVDAELRVDSWRLQLDLQHVVNDTAMAIFFMVVGLEISRELVVGELRDRRTLLVPALGAIGGLLLPALVYFAIVQSGPAAGGWGIPMSTDTAFVVGVLALFGPRCPDQLRLFLLALAIVDDIGAITVMALFYSKHISLPALLVSAALVAALIGLRVLGMWRLTPYMLLGIALWLAVYQSGVHPTLAGVLVGLIVPAAPVDVEHRRRLYFYGRAVIEAADPRRVRLVTAAARATVSANDRLQDALHPASAYVVLPLFGLANAGVPLDAHTLRAAATSRVTIAVVLALIVGKSVGVSLASGLALRVGRGSLPGAVRYGHLLGGSVLAGIGFTISLFITDLAFTDEGLRHDAKIGVLAGSLLAAVAGSLLLRYLGERLPLCTVPDAAGPPPLPQGPWLDPTTPGLRTDAGSSS
ncbi:MAG TPA: Na+/H+ antiporter NhaA [Jatrophihabitans sp.]|nr:Na+/H+ antiporter NhaA [Jatrophihabitans sp.]